MGHFQMKRGAGASWLSGGLEVCEKDEHCVLRLR